MIKKIYILLFLLMSTSLLCQNLDQYKYVVVANKFDFLKKPDQYQTSSLTKFLLEKKGFIVFLDNEKYPEEVVNNRCLMLSADVLEESTMFTTKTAIQFKDCYGKVVYKSKLGKSKLKEYKKAYQEAIRAAYATMEDLEYSFNPVKEKEQKEAKSVEVVPVSKISSEIINNTSKENEEKIKVESKTTIEILYAQKLENGFQLVNTKPEVVFKVLNTNLNQVYLIEGRSGIFYKVGESWLAEYYENNKLVQKMYQVKF